ncbi:ABC transporter permease [Nocardioides carbamazepini]|uniref:ABC transporter permease n=1 Tax=Nocardioides carbamazepini TaxID=2854259 RepID=UPI0021499A2F|nr:ABC transporter permease [Nocardioides carbamazepini]MCR1783991.1 ABC transporter permease [Nocardioides carbamazepini]
MTPPSAAALRALGLRLLTQLAVALVTLLMAALILLAIGVSPTVAADAFWAGTFGSPTNAGTTLTQAVPLFLVALGWIVTDKAGRLQVGFPGQVVIGGCAAAAVGLQCENVPAPLAVMLCAAAGMLGGALWAGIVAWLWASRGVLEIVSSLLLNLVAIQVLAWLVRGPLQGSLDQQPQSADFPESTRWPAFPSVPGLTLSYDVLLMPVLAVGLIVVLSRTSFGFSLRASGGNVTAARWQGIDPVRTGVRAIALSGAFAGLAGAALLFAGSAPWLSEGFEAGIGFNGIAVALLARNSPVGAMFTAVVFASLNVGGTSLQSLLDVPSTLTSVLQGAVIVLVLVAAAVAVRRRSTTPPEPAPAPAEPSGRVTAAAGQGA